MDRRIKSGGNEELLNSRERGNGEACIRLREKRGG
jgi:hypothetical protein